MSDPVQKTTEDDEPLPVLSPAQQDIQVALMAAREFVEWPAGQKRQREVVAAIDRALTHVQHIAAQVAAAEQLRDEWYQAYLAARPGSVQ